MRLHRIELPTPFPVGPVNAYLLAGEPLTLVDAGPRTPQAQA
ncbi:MAG: MBL fold metallo-hydrolase, partial [Armatimonadota bacterium]|nr:MBL fold metallo-hydrolase [Armatimonadota bacterium]